VFWKFVVDLVVGSLVLWSFFVDYFNYLQNFTFSLFEVTFTFQYHGLNAYSQVDYGTYKEQHCATPSQDEAVICTYLSQFQVAGICYLIVCVLVLALTVYNVFNEFGLMCYCDCCHLQRFKYFHYTLPYFYLLAVLLYLFVTQVFILTAPEPYSRESDAHLMEGVWLMGAIFVIAMGNSVYFLVIRNDIEVVVKASRKEYQQLLGNKLRGKDS
jgi:hypothetical protein